MTLESITLGSDTLDFEIGDIQVFSRMQQAILEFSVVVPTSRDADLLKVLIESSTQEMNFWERREIDRLIADARKIVESAKALISDRFPIRNKIYNITRWPRR